MSRWRATLAACLATLAGSALAEVPADAPRPLPRPALVAAAEAPATLRPRARPDRPGDHVLVAVSTMGGVRPLPRPAVAATAPATADEAGTRRMPVIMAIATSPRPLARRPGSGADGARIELAAVIVPPQPAIITGKKGAVCGDPAIRGQSIGTIAGKLKGCGLEDGVKVTSVAGVALSTPAIVDCTTAKALKRWVEEGARPAVGSRGGGLAQLQVAASYACRPRNNQSGARISEHGRGRAVDIAALVLADGTRITVEDGWGSKASGGLLKKARAEACGPFNTVLGPGSDRHHHDHFHFDTARGRGPYCR